MKGADRLDKGKGATGEMKTVKTVAGGKVDAGGRKA